MMTSVMTRRGHVFAPSSSLGGGPRTAFVLPLGLFVAQKAVQNVNEVFEKGALAATEHIKDDTHRRRIYHALSSPQNMLHAALSMHGEGPSEDAPPPPPAPPRLFEGQHNPLRLDFLTKHPLLAKSGVVGQLAQHAHAAGSHLLNPLADQAKKLAADHNNKNNPFAQALSQAHAALEGGARRHIVSVFGQKDEYTVKANAIMKKLEQRTKLSETDRATIQELTRVYKARGTTFPQIQEILFEHPRKS